MKVVKRTPAWLLCAMAVLALATVGVVGGTWAYMAFQDSMEGTVSGAKVSVAADMTAVATSSTISTYSGTNTFENNGTAKIEDGALVIENMAEGDQADVTVTLTNTSTIDVAYRVSYETEGTLPLTVSVSDYEEWTTWTVADASTARTFTLTVVYPYSEPPNYADGTGTFTITCKVETVQANAPIVNGGTTEEPETPEHTHTYDQESDKIATAATCTANQTNYYKCSCGEVGTTTYEVADTAGHGAVASIAVTTNPTKTAYTAGETFDKTGMVVTATCEKENCPTYAVTEYTVDKTEALTTADTTVTVTHEGKTAEVAITVEEVVEPEEPVEATTLTMEAESAKSATYSNGTVVATPAADQASGGKYLHYTHSSSTGDATVTYEVTATEATTMALEIALGHRSAALNAINTQCKIYINDVEVTISDDLKFTIDGWEQDSDGDGVKGDWYTFEEFNLGNITLNEGVNTIKILISTDSAFEIDYLTLTGDTTGVTQVVATTEEEMA